MSDRISGVFRHNVTSTQQKKKKKRKLFHGIPIPDYYINVTIVTLESYSGLPIWSTRIIRLCILRFRVTIQFYEYKDFQLRMKRFKELSWLIPNYISFFKFFNTILPGIFFNFRLKRRMIGSYNLKQPFFPFIILSFRSAYNIFIIY